jgi:hypothetical protein
MRLAAHAALVLPADRRDLLFIVNLLGFLEFEGRGGSFDLNIFVASSASLPQFAWDFYS